MPALKHCSKPGEWKELIVSMRPGDSKILPCFAAANSLRASARRLGLRVSVHRVAPRKPEHKLTLLP
jgi:hypothetical protein